MEILEEIKKDFMVAYKSKEMEKKNFLGVLKSEVTNQDKNPSNDYIISKIKSMIKNASKTNSLNDMELECLNKYLPTQMSEVDMEMEVKNFLKNNPTSNMGQIMGYFSSTFKGLYDGKSLSNIVRKSL